MQINRQVLVSMLKRFARTAIENDDGAYGKQLATICEQVAISLRLKFGGKSVLLDLSVRAKPAVNGRPERPKPVGKPYTVPDRSAADEAFLAAWKAAYAAEDPHPETLPVPLDTANTICAHVRAFRADMIEQGYRKERVVDIIKLASDGSEHRISIWPVDNRSTGAVPLSHQGDDP